MADFSLFITNGLPIQNSSLKSNSPQHIFGIVSKMFGTLVDFYSIFPESDHNV